MKTLNQYCPGVRIFMFHGFNLAAAKIEILYILTKTQKHWEEHDLILYFHFLLS